MLCGPASESSSQNLRCCVAARMRETRQHPALLERSLISAKHSAGHKLQNVPVLLTSNVLAPGMMMTVHKMCMTTEAGQGGQGSVIHPPSEVASFA